MEKSRLCETERAVKEGRGDRQGPFLALTPTHQDCAPPWPHAAQQRPWSLRSLAVRVPPLESEPPQSRLHQSKWTSGQQSTVKVRRAAAVKKGTVDGTHIRTLNLHAPNNRTIAARRMSGPTSLTLYVKWKDGWSRVLTDEPPLAVGKYTGSPDADGYKLLEAQGMHINLHTLGLSILSRDQHTPPHKRGSGWSACAGLWGRQGSPPSARPSPGGRLCTAAWSGLSGGGPSRRPCLMLSSPRTAGTRGLRQPLREAPGRTGQGTAGGSTD